jgi:hypothetical protein
MPRRRQPTPAQTHRRITSAVKQVLKVCVTLMNSVGGIPYKDIEHELKLIKSNGMTAWRLAGKKHKRP